MLVEFSFGNFRSFKNEATLSMEPFTQNGKDPNAINTNLKKIPQLYRTSGIFGANASGKSNVIKAFVFLKFMVEESSKFVVGDEFPREMYALAKENENKPMNFAVKFIVDNTLYDYKFSLLKNIVTSESLYVSDISDNGSSRSKRVFDRCNTNGEIIFEKSQGILQSWINELIDNRLFLSDVVNNRKCKVETIHKAYNWITTKLRVTDAYKTSKGFSLSQIFEGKGKEIIKLIKKADLGLENIEVTNVTVEELLETAKNNKEKIPEKVIEALFNGEDKVFASTSYHRTEDGTVKYFDFDDMESDGTKRFLALSGILSEALKLGKVVVFDELDNNLHPNLVKYLVEIFNSPKSNPHNAQLIFTSHAHYLMDGEHLSRDQVWLTTKEVNNGFSSELYSLSDMKIKYKNISFYEAYMNGVYGAVPNLEKL